MFCKNCGTQMKDGSRFCPKCGTSVINTSVRSGNVQKQRNPLWIMIVSVVLVVILIVTIFAVFNRSKNGMRSGEDAAGAYLVACYEEDADTIISLVPDEILKEIMKQYGCSEKQLKEAVEAEIPYESKRYDYCGSVKDCRKTDTIDETNYSHYLDDYRVEDCVDLKKISNMEIYWVDVEDNYYYNNIAVYQYKNNKHIWYNAEATIFVAYAVWEEY